jgi:ferredoxin
LGAIYGFFCKLALLGGKVDKDKCTDCGLCIAACKMDTQKVSDHECIQCGECISVCPTKAISWKGGKLFVKKDDLDAPVVTEMHSLASMVQPPKKEEDSVKGGHQV